MSYPFDKINPALILHYKNLCDRNKIPLENLLGKLLHDSIGTPALAKAIEQVKVALFNEMMEVAEPLKELPEKRKTDGREKSEDNC